MEWLRLPAWADETASVCAVQFTSMLDLIFFRLQQVRASLAHRLFGIEKALLAHVQSLCQSMPPVRGLILERKFI